MGQGGVPVPLDQVTGNAPDIVIGAPDQPWAFLLACLVVALGAFLLWQAGQLQKWRFATESGAPSWVHAPVYGFLVAILTGLVGFAWLVVLNHWSPPEVEDQFLYRSGSFVPVALLVAVPLLVLAGYSFLVTAVGLRRQSEDTQSSGWPILGAITAFTALAAAILRLLEAIKTHP